MVLLVNFIYRRRLYFSLQWYSIGEDQVELSVLNIFLKILTIRNTLVIIFWEYKNSGLLMMVKRFLALQKSQFLWNSEASM
jgi:hypothetical protein